MMPAWEFIDDGYAKVFKAAYGATPFAWDRVGWATWAVRDISPWEYVLRAVEVSSWDERSAL